MGLLGIPLFIFAAQYGFTTGSGVIANVVDRDLLTSWTPLATDFSAYTDQFFKSDGTLNYGKSFPAIEIWGRNSDHDPVVAQTVTSMIFKLAGPLTLGPCIVIGSNNQATSVADTLQVGDVFLGSFTGAQLASGEKVVLTLPAQKTGATAFKFYRILQRSNTAAAAPPDPNVGTNFHIFDTPGSLSFTVPTYSGTFTMEIWGPGATGGDNTGGVDGAAATTIAAYSLSAGPGKHSTASGPNGGAAGATGGVASGGNTANVNGNPGNGPSSNDTAVGTSGAGADAPNGGAGGDAVAIGVFGGLVGGKDGQAPGGGGSGAAAWSNTSGGVAFKYPGGGSGAYVKHVLTFGAGGPTPGDVISFVIGAAGVRTKPIGDGNGANGRVKFSWT